MGRGGGRSSPQCKPSLVASLVASSLSLPFLGCTGPVVLSKRPPCPTVPSAAGGRFPARSGTPAAERHGTEEDSNIKREATFQVDQNALRHPHDHDSKSSLPVSQNKASPVNKIKRARGPNLSLLMVNALVWLLGVRWEDGQFRDVLSLRQGAKKNYKHNKHSFVVLVLPIFSGTYDTGAIRQLANTLARAGDGLLANHRKSTWPIQLDVA